MPDLSSQDAVPAELFGKASSSQVVGRKSNVKIDTLPPLQTFTRHYSASPSSSCFLHPPKSSTPAFLHDPFLLVLEDCKSPLGFLHLDYYTMSMSAQNPPQKL